MESQDTKKEFSNEIVEKGHKALIDALGPSGAMEFLRVGSDILRASDDSDGVKRVLMEIYADKNTKEVVLTFSQSVTWMRFSPKDAMKLAKDIIDRAGKISAS